LNAAFVVTILNLISCLRPAYTGKYAQNIISMYQKLQLSVGCHIEHVDGEEDLQTELSFYILHINNA